MNQKIFTPRNILYISLVLLFFSILGSTVLCDDEFVVFEPYSVTVWDTGFLFRESVIRLEAYDRTSDLNYSSQSLLVYIMDDRQYQSYTGSNSFIDSFTPRGNNLEGIESTTSTYINYRIPYEDHWHIVIANKAPASQDNQEKTYEIKIIVDQKAGILRYPALLGLIASVVLYHTKRKENKLIP